MSDPDRFLSRWSRRKLEPSQAAESSDTPAGEQAADARASSAAPEAESASVPAPDQPQEQPFDPLTLPPVESITAETDIRDFLKPGVPLSLSREALRRAWTSDPVIREFIEMAENQWDFNNNSIPGFGVLDPADIPRLLAQILPPAKDSAEKSGSLEDQSESLDSAARPAANEATDGEATDIAETGENETPAPAEEHASASGVSEREVSHSNDKNDAVQNEGAQPQLSYAQNRNRHGGALPG
jgi:hypothetical protein